MYGEIEISKASRIFLNSGHFLAVVFSAWLLFGGGIETAGALIGRDWRAGDGFRRGMLLFCSIIYFVRVIATSSIFVKRKMAWSEAVTIVVWVWFIHTLFALLGGMSDTPATLLERSGLGLYLLGSFINSGSEFERMWWKAKPENKGRLYTRGLFRYLMHVNYFGDTLLFTGFAIITRSPWALIVPALMCLLFVSVNIPMLDKYLAEKYGDEFEEYSKRTAKFIPWVY
jgi:protein-S-isoprenylcysteine O-methyltransferase Ste14